MVRAVTAQSIRRTSSPGWYARASPGSLPGPRHQAEVVALQQPVEPAAHRQLQGTQRGLDATVAQRRRRRRGAAHRRPDTGRGAARHVLGLALLAPGVGGPPGAGAGAVDGLIQRGCGRIDQQSCRGTRRVYPGAGGRAVTCGNGTVASTRPMMWSTGTASATAS